MRLKLVLLNLLLAGGVAAVAWQARLHMQLAQAERQANLHVRIRSITAPAVQPVAKPDAPAAIKYVDVANKNLFTADRNPNVVIDPPKIEAPKPMPALPVVYGTMGLPSGTKAIMAAKPGEPSRSVRLGDSIGDFKVLALSTEKVTFGWENKQVEKRIEDLIDRSNTPVTGNPRGPAAPPSNAAPVAGGGQPANPAAAAPGKPGNALTPTERACTGDNSPPGTVVDGYTKQFTPSPFGAINCRWIKQ